MSRKPNANQTETERNYWRLVAEDEGNQDRAERTLGAKLDAELIAAGQAAFLATWPLDRLQAVRAKWNAASGTIAQREALLGVSLMDITTAKRLHGIK